MTPGEVCSVALDKFVRFATCLVGVVGAAVLVGWVLDVALLKTVLPGLATMKVNTAFGFIFSAAALWLLHTSAPGSRAVHVARVLAVFVIVIGGATVAEDVFGVNFGIDQFVLPNSAAAGLHPGRMSLATALGFFALGFTLLAFKARHARLAATAPWLAIPPLLISTQAIISYAYGFDALYRVGLYSSMALHTALSLFILTLSIVAAETSHGFARIATSDTVGGEVSRRLLPTLPLMLFVLGWLCLQAERAGWYEIHFGVALTILLSVIVSVVAVAWTATVLHNTDITRKRAETEIKSLNADLELRVQERTRRLGELSEKLREANKALEQLSLHDSLTGLANRRHFDSYLASQVATSHRYKRSLALILCDVDAFKAYNDHYGHQAGDECLRRLRPPSNPAAGAPPTWPRGMAAKRLPPSFPKRAADGAFQIAQSIKEAVAQSANSARLFAGE